MIAGLGVPEFDVEGRVLIAEYPSFVLMNIYYPNGKMSAERLAYKMRFYDAFLEFADGLSAAGQRVVVCGDVNTAHREVDIARPKENAKISGFRPEERAWIDKFLAHGYVDTFRMFDDRAEQYSYWDVKSRARERNVGWRIDYFFVNGDFRDSVKGAWIMPEVARGPTIAPSESSSTSRRGLGLMGSAIVGVGRRECLSIPTIGVGYNRQEAPRKCASLNHRDIAEASSGFNWQSTSTRPT